MGIDPYPVSFARSHQAAEIDRGYGELPAGAETNDRVRVAGRIRAARNSGMFIDLHDASGKIQVFSHKDHLENYKCADCHTKVFPYQAGAKKYTMEQMAEGKSCGACHNGKDAFSSQDDCIKCHTSWSK